MDDFENRGGVAGAGGEGKSALFRLVADITSIKNIFGDAKRGHVRNML